jgi:DEAD/DEAH box helicase domain-containing protein
MTLSPFSLFMEATNANVVEHIELPARPERLRAAPGAFAQGPIGAWLNAMIGGATMPWLHQSLALEKIAEGKNVVIATGTASGKSLVFQAAVVRELLESDGRALLLFPQKALVSDQLRRLVQALEVAGLDRELVGMIHGDIGMAERDEVLERAKVIVATADTVHSWLMRQSSSPLVQKFLAELKLLVIDEAHVLEGVFGSNAAFLFRRLFAAQRRVSKEARTQVIAATATIVDPAGHLEKLTGCPFEAITEDDNGAPFHGLTLLHVEGPAYGAPAEKLAADFGTSLAAAIGEDAFILFNDSRQGVERITRYIKHDGVLPYRGGYDHKDRRRIEELLHSNGARGIISTSALELGVDIPQFSIGVNIGVPQTRKAFRQRVGRIGRSSAGLFVVTAPPPAFSQIGTTLKEFYEGPVEPSHLYTSNRFIQFQHARCLVEECAAEELGQLDRNWPTGFAEMVRIAQPGSPRPRDLDHIAALGGDSPHISYPLRAMCETSYALRSIRNASEIIGKIELDKAIREAYPGATHYHLGRAYRVIEWRNSSYEHSIMLEPLKGAQPTQPLLRTCVSVSFDAAEVIDGRYAAGEGGCLAEISLRVTDSVEGYRLGSTAMPYRELRKDNPRMCRRYREASSTGVVIRISEPWFAGSGDASIKTRDRVAEALKVVLAMEHNVAPAELRSAHQNISLCSLAGAKPLDDAIVVFDNVAGGLRLSAPLFSSFPALLDRLERAASLAGDEALLAKPTVDRLRQWHAGLRVAAGRPAGAPELASGEIMVFAPESEVAVRVRGVLEERKLIEPQFLSMGEQDVLMYRYEAAPDVHAWVAHDQIQAIGSNWSQVIWNPSSNQFREIEA